MFAIRLNSKFFGVSSFYAAMENSTIPNINWISPKLHNYRTTKIQPRHSADFNVFVKWMFVF